jgi:hypothetical protein
MLLMYQWQVEPVSQPITRDNAVKAILALYIPRPVRIAVHEPSVKDQSDDSVLELQITHRDAHSSCR